MMKIISILLFILCSQNSSAEELKSRAFRLYSRLCSTPPTSSELQLIQVKIQNGQEFQAALDIMDRCDDFYNVTLPTWVKSWSNQAESSRVPFNDMTATIIGMVRDDLPFNEVLFSDRSYIADFSKLSSSENNSLKMTGGASLDMGNFGSEWSGPEIDTHFSRYETLNLNYKQILKEVPQSILYHNNLNVKTAGVITSHSYSNEFFRDGTNRRVTRYTFKNFLCKDFEDLHDTTLSDFRVGSDVDRSPGGDSKIYMNSCVGCHAFQDQLRGGWARFDTNPSSDRLVHSLTVPTKYNKNRNTFPFGYVTVNDSWINPLIYGKNANLGWRGVNSGGGNGDGARTLGQYLSSSKQFALCMSKKAFTKICVRNPRDSDMPAINKMANDFETIYNYKLKKLFASASVACKELEE